MTDDPVSPEYKEELNWIAALLDEFFNREREPGEPKKIGFCLMIFEMDAPGPRVNYISNAQRPAMIEALKQFIERDR